MVQTRQTASARNRIQLLSARTGNVLIENMYAMVFRIVVTRATSIIVRLLNVTNSSANQDDAYQVDTIKKII